MSESKPDPRPDPLVPSFVDLRGLPFMPVDTVRLLDSDTFALASGDEFKAAFTMWCKAWQQVPAATLPTDERILASWVSGFARWKNVREFALRGFVECKDGRLHHRVIADKALEAWEYRTKQRAKAARRWHKSDPDPELPGVPPGYPAGNPDGSSRADAAAYDEATVHRETNDPAAMQVKGQGQLRDSSSKKGRGEGKLSGRPAFGTAMVMEWQLPDRWRDWTVEALGWTPKRALQFSIYFRDQCLAKGIVSRDWFATWRVWCNNEVRFEQERRGSRHA